MNGIITKGSVYSELIYALEMHRSLTRASIVQSFERIGTFPMDKYFMIIFEEENLLKRIHHQPASADQALTHMCLIHSAKRGCSHSRG